MFGAVTLLELVEKRPSLSFSVTLAMCNPTVYAGVRLPVLVKKLQAVDCASADHSHGLSGFTVQVSGTLANFSLQVQKVLATEKSGLKTIL